MINTIFNLHFMIPTMALIDKSIDYEQYDGEEIGGGSDTNRLNQQQMLLSLSVAVKPQETQENIVAVMVVWESV